MGVLQSPLVMVYTRKKVQKVEETVVTVTAKNNRTTEHSFLPDYAQVSKHPFYIKEYTNKLEIST